MLTRAAQWWLARADRRRRAKRAVGECVCGAPVAGRKLHRVIAISDDDDQLGIEGHTAMSADFCRKHCPGGCLRGCVPSTR